MILPLRTDSPLRHTPYMNWAIIAANCAGYLLQLSANPQAPDQANFVQSLMLTPYDPHLWQYVTYAFLHANLLHIVGNMLFLYIFGNNVNDRMGHLGYLAFYLSGAVFAGVGYVVFDRAAPVLGASGAVAAVTGAYLILLPRSNITILYFLFFIGVIEVASLWVILFFFLTDLLGEVAPQFMGGAAAVAHMAHISGTIYGAAVSFFLLATRLLPRDQFDVLALVKRWNQRREYRDMVNRGFDPFGAGARSGWAGGGAGSAPPTPEPMAQILLDLRDRISRAAAGHDLAAASTLYLDLLQRDPNQVMSRGVQLDIANYLAAQHLYPQSAASYELLLRFYPRAEQIEQVYLMLGVIYSRYLQQPAKAREYLLRAIAGLHFSNQIEVAKAELEHVEAVLGQQRT
jgi:membrane associated rhomboid family serine protease